MCVCLPVLTSMAGEHGELCVTVKEGVHFVTGLSQGACWLVGLFGGPRLKVVKTTALLLYSTSKCFTAKITGELLLCS